MMEVAVIAVAFMAFLAFGVGRVLALIDAREQRAHEARNLRTSDVNAIAEKARDVEAALVVHEKRICELELAHAGGAPRQRRIG